MKSIRNLFSFLSFAMLLAVGAAQAAPPAWVLACSQGARRVALAAFKDPAQRSAQDPRGYFTLGANLKQPVTDAGWGLKQLPITVLDIRQQGAKFCEACAIFNEAQGDVREIRLTGAPQGHRPLQDWEYKTHATMAATALHSIRYPDANPNDVFESAQPTYGAPWGKVVMRVRVRSSGWYSGATYEVTMAKDQMFPVETVKIVQDSISGSWPSISDPHIRMAAGVGAQNVAMATMSRQPVARNVFTNIHGMNGWGGTYSAVVDILDSTTGSGRPLGRAEVVVDAQSALVREIKYSPAKTTPPRTPYTQQVLELYAADAAAGLFAARRPDGGDDCGIQGVQIQQAGWNEVLAHVAIKDGESDQIQRYEVRLSTQMEFPVLSVRFVQ